jgi:cytochrome c
MRPGQRLAAGTRAMRRPARFACALCWLAMALPAAGQEALLQRSGCLSCHALDRQLVGPAYRRVAERYRGRPEAAAMLFQKVRQGGTGAWGHLVMPPNPQVGDEDLKALIQYILSQ